MYSELGAAMGVTYFKRFRMEIDLAPPCGAEEGEGRYDPAIILSLPPLPDNYFLVGWDPVLLDAHIDVKYRSFCFEIDANVFPCLGDRDGCRRLMGEISRREGFLPEATWLVGYRPSGRRQAEYCGTVQGLRDRHGLGAVQNLGIVPEHRGRGLGAHLLRAALDGFRRCELQRAFLEVTAQNECAVRLYQRLGFRKARTVYKAVEMAYA